MVETKQAESKAKSLKEWAKRWRWWLVGYIAILLVSVGVVYTWRVMFWLEAVPSGPFVLCVAAVLSLFYLAVFLACRFCKDNVSLRGAVLVFLMGLLFCFASAPLQAPDENIHFLRAYAIADGHFDYDAQRAYPEDVTVLVREFYGFYNHATTYGGEELAPAAFQRYQDGVAQGVAAQDLATEPVLFTMLPFLPQALGILVARLLGFGALGALYGARIANLLAYAAVAYFTFKNCDTYRGVFMAAVMLPLSLFMAASCSYDCLMLAVCYLLISYFCKAEVTNKDLVVFALGLAFVTYIKPMNVVLAAVLLMIPKSRWKARVNPWLATIGIAVVGMLVWKGLGWVDFNLLQHNYPAELERGSGEVNSPAEQIQFVLRNPFSFVSRALLTVYEAGAFMPGLGVFGWTDLTIPLVAGLSLLSLAGAGALGVQTRTETKWTSGLALFLAAVLYSGTIILGMYIFDTDLFSIRVTGVQTRYFLPAILMMAMVVSITLGKVLRPALPDVGARARSESVVVALALAVALVAAVLLFQNYFVGQWISSAGGQWKMVNLFGWQVT